MAIVKKNSIKWFTLDSKNYRNVNKICGSSNVELLSVKHTKSWCPNINIFVTFKIFAAII